MGFVIRSAFWLSAVLLMLPLGGGDEEGASVGPVQTLLAARDAVSDIAGICERKPTVCETGRTAMQTIAARAGEGARIAYKMLDEGDTDAVATGSIEKPARPDPETGGAFSGEPAVPPQELAAQPAK